jgi:hypothetical protein
MHRHSTLLLSNFFIQLEAPIFGCQISVCTELGSGASEALVKSMVFQEKRF